jgi:hypothetical protein
VVDPLPIRDATDLSLLVDPSWKKLVPVADLATWQGRSAPDRQWVLQDWLPHCQGTYLTGPGSAASLRSHSSLRRKLRLAYLSWAPPFASRTPCI